VEEGRIGELLVGEGTDEVPVGSAIATILTEEEEGEESREESGESAETEAESPAEGAGKKEALSISSGGEGERSGGEGERAERRIIASPLARRLARENNIDLAAIRGTGPRGRIVKRDLTPLMTGSGAGAAVGGATSAPAMTAASVGGALAASGAAMGAVHPPEGHGRRGNQRPFRARQLGNRAP
jgi:pyruvate dehydrogenase E2 component (dihydrolipoamide acetyltransferase)